MEDEQKKWYGRRRIKSNIEDKTKLKIKDEEEKNGIGQKKKTTKF